MIRKLILIFFFYYSQIIIAQENILTDRPDQTESVYLTPKNFLQLEAGIIHENSNENLKIITLPSILWKYGVSKNFEVRMITEAIRELENKNKFGFLPIAFGVKTKLIEESKFIPKISFLGHLSINNLSSKEYRSNEITPDFRFLFQHTLTDKLSLGYNLGIEWQKENPNKNFIYTLALSNSFNDKLSAYLEFYGFKNNLYIDNRINGGLVYLIHNDLQIDLSSGLGLSENSSKNFVSIGISHRFKL